MTATASARRHLRPVWMLSAAVAVLVAGLVVTTAISSGLPGHSVTGRIFTGHSGGGASAKVSAAPPLAVSGTSPSGLAPGVTRPVTVTVRNPSGTHVKLKTVTITVGNASKTCKAAGNITTTSYKATVKHAKPYTVWQGHRARVPLTITMLDSKKNQDACKGRAFPLTFNATGKKG